MYEIRVPATIQKIIAIFYLLRLWSKDVEIPLYKIGRKLFFSFYYYSFIASVALGALLTDDKDERAFLTVASLTAFTLTYKMVMILWKREEISALIHETGTHSTQHQEEYICVNNKLQMFMKYVHYFLVMVLIGFTFVVILFPIANENRLFLNIAFPLDPFHSETAFWVVYAYSAGGTFSTAVVCGLFNSILWYLLYNFVLKYEMLGNEFRKMGKQDTTESESQPTVGKAKHRSSYVKDLIAAIQIYDQINGQLEGLASMFSDLFFLQIATSSVCICGSVHILAFSSHSDLIQDGVLCILLAYNFFDIFVVMYLANEITFSSDKLSYSLFESNWTEQTQSCKRCILILGERLKRPQEIIVGKIYPMNLITFTSIVNSAYSMFNILQNLSK